MKKYQWILYDQCHKVHIEPGVTDIVFFLYTRDSIVTPVGKTVFNLRSKIAEYAIARSFLAQCEQDSYRTHFREVTSYRSGIGAFLREMDTPSIVLMTPSELYLKKRILSWNLPIEMTENRQFLMTEKEFRHQFEKPPIMEYFYRYMRKSRNILIEADGSPTGGRWNYDSENRKFDRDHTPSTPWKPTDTRFLDEARSHYHAETLECSFPTTREDALALLTHFLEHHAATFGDLEDAMYRDDPLVHHSLLSIPLNFSLLLPHEVIDAILAHDLPIASREALIRQILGWREYVRQFYLYYSDDIYEQNALDHHEKIPAYWWSYDGKEHPGSLTSMHCVDTVLHRVQTTNYSHHIERLMILGNYALMRGYHPLEVNRWFYEMYVDAFEWVVTPNVLAMSQYSDGGRLATKPYISGGNYIEKMSDYCRGCRYSVKEKTCPMTALYWDFVDRNTSLFSNGRNPYIISNLAKIDLEKIRAMKAKFEKIS